jgi:glycosyltransferase involved in cell wall biosynthesis
VIPNGVDLSIFKPSKNKKENNVPILLFHGNFEGTNSNREAAHFIVNKIYPSLRKKLGDAFEIQIIGKGCEKLLNEVKFKNIKIISYADKIEKLLSRGDIYIAPIFSGSGMKNKILEAMAVGLPVIGTAEAFMGIEAENLVHCIKVNDTEEFVSSIINLINDKELRRAIGYRAFSLVKKNFSWDSIVVKYISLYEELLKNNKK